jgi:hypothetical protein
MRLLCAPDVIAPRSGGAAPASQIFPQARKLCLQGAFFRRPTLIFREISAEFYQIHCLIEDRHE